MKKTKLDGLALTIAIIGIILIAAFPVIIWDALGNGAQHFMKYGNSAATFLFGTFYSENFNVVKLFSSQWRVVLGINQATGTPASDTLAVFTLIGLIGLILTCAYEIVMPIINKILKGNLVLEKVDKWGKLVTMILCLIAIIFIGTPVIVMATKIQKYGTDAFLKKDFSAYGGFKGIIEVIIALILMIINSIKFVRKTKSSKE